MPLEQKSSYRLIGIIELDELVDLSCEQAGESKPACDVDLGLRQTLLRLVERDRLGASAGSRMSRTGTMPQTCPAEHATRHVESLALADTDRLAADLQERTAELKQQIELARR